MPTETDAGFTLLELIVVMVIMGLVLGLVLTHGPMRSPRLAEAAAVQDIAQGLQDAASRAIAQDRTTKFQLDPQTGVWREGARHGTIPAGTAIGFHGVAAGRMGTVMFAPDGSASGGRITLASAGGVRVIAIDWLTGQIRIDAPQPGR
ncbi:MAG: GspH/FimT family pseudopilin [Acidiphilium sp.]|nr:GspH/FimT family pseudopilin [Acidiphilium sp.]MDD4935626.1 GspH/FimT family pseudopilin [Acidiphilium sp.]